MAVLAGRGIRATGFQCQAVNTRAVAFGLSFMAAPAIDRFGGEIVIWMLPGQIGMTARAGVGPVHRGSKLRWINKQRNFFPGCIRLAERFIGMTFQTIAVLKPGPHRNLDGEQGRDPN